MWISFTKKVNLVCKRMDNFVCKKKNIFILLINANFACISFEKRWISYVKSWIWYVNRLINLAKGWILHAKALQIYLFQKIYIQISSFLTFNSFNYISDNIKI